MKPHILIPLLVVCVGLPVVAIGTYYVCDNFPVAEGMRNREVQYKEDIRREAERIKEERRLVRGRAKENPTAQRDGELRQHENTKTIPDERPSAVSKKGARDEAALQFIDDSLHVAISGVTINQSHERLKQELAKKFGTIEVSDKKPDELIYSFGGFDSDKKKVPPKTQLIIKSQLGSYFLDEAWSDEDLKQNGEVVEFKGESAFGGKVYLIEPSIVEIRFFGPVTMNQETYENARQASKNYEAALNKKFGEPTFKSKEETIKYTWRSLFAEGGTASKTLKVSFCTRQLSDGIIVSVAQEILSVGELPPTSAATDGRYYGFDDRYIYLNNATLNRCKEKIQKGKEQIQNEKQKFAEEASSI